jgi:hypothetical protein
MDWMRSSPRGDLRQVLLLLLLGAAAHEAFITYIWPWQAPELPPLRLISSMITEASAMAQARAAVLLRDQRGHPAGLVSASTKASG